MKIASPFILLVILTFFQSCSSFHHRQFGTYVSPLKKLPKNHATIHFRTTHTIILSNDKSIVFKRRKQLYSTTDTGTYHLSGDTVFISYATPTKVSITDSSRGNYYQGNNSNEIRRPLKLLWKRRKLYMIFSPDSLNYVYKKEPFAKLKRH
jgi:hypothetical protein